MKTAYSEYGTETVVSSDEVHSFDAWCDSRKQQSPHFQLWYLVLSMELKIQPLSHPIVRGSYLRPIPLVTGWTNPILLRQQQCELRTMGSHPSETCRHWGRNTPSWHMYSREEHLLHTNQAK